jgi:hypothetical protein
MSCEHLVCAGCAGPVPEGRCPACRAARDERHHAHPQLSTALMIELVAIIAAAITLLTLVATHG